MTVTSRCRCWTPSVPESFPSGATALVNIGSLVTNDPQQGSTALGLLSDAAVVVDDGPALTAFVARCLAEPAWAESLGRRAAALVASQRGATAATARIVLERLAVAQPRPRAP